MKTMEIKMYGETYKLDWFKSVYASNGKPYLGLINTSDGEMFSDVSFNDGDIETQPNEYLLNRDFVLCFDGDVEKTKEWLGQHLNIKMWRNNNGYDSFIL